MAPRRDSLNFGVELLARQALPRPRWYSFEVVEFLDVIGPLTDPKAHGGDRVGAFHLVIPSLPGFGFSGPTHEPRWDSYRIAGAFAELMGRLGYGRYGAQGGDFGAFIWPPRQGRPGPHHWRARQRCHRGLHQGELMGIPPSGNRVEVTGISVDRIEGGKFVEGWSNYDALGMMQQIGAVPAAEQTQA